MTKYSKNDRVKWNWGNGTGNGKIVEGFTSTVTRTLQGSEVKRRADNDNPAYLIEQDDGAQVLKSESELEARE